MSGEIRRIVFGDSDLDKEIIRYDVLCCSAKDREVDEDGEYYNINLCNIKQFGFDIYEGEMSLVDVAAMLLNLLAQKGYTKDDLLPWVFKAAEGFSRDYLPFPEIDESLLMHNIVKTEGV